MTETRMIRILATCLGLLAVSAAAANACASGAKCMRPERNISVAPYAPGDVLPRGKYQILLNSGYYGLPATRDGSLYFKVERYVMRVNPSTMEVIEDVTDKVSRTF